MNGLDIGKYRIEPFGKIYCIFEDGWHLIFKGSLPDALIFLGNKLKEVADE